MSQKRQQSATWWGNFSLDIGQISYWNIGPLSLYIQRLDKEWNVVFRRDESMRNADSWHHEHDTTLPAGDFESKRFIFSKTDSALTITPALADRPVVIRPETPLHIPAAQVTTLFVSTPLWLKLQVHAPLIGIQEIPIIRPSDTWFGPTTMDGELSYASQTLARLTMENFPHLPHRAVTPVTIHNNTEESFQLERVNLTVPYLSLYCSDNNHLWTEQVTMTREPDDAAAILHIDNGAPAQATGAILINERRLEIKSSSLISKVSELFE